MWLVARGAMADVVAGGAKPKVAHRFYHVPASNTAVGHLILENAAVALFRSTTDPVIASEARNHGDVGSTSRARSR